MSGTYYGKLSKGRSLYNQLPDKYEVTLYKMYMERGITK